MVRLASRSLTSSQASCKLLQSRLTTLSTSSMPGKPPMTACNPEVYKAARPIVVEREPGNQHPTIEVVLVLCPILVGWRFVRVPAAEEVDRADEHLTRLTVAWTLPWLKALVYSTRMGPERISAIERFRTLTPGFARIEDRAVGKHLAVEQSRKFVDGVASEAVRVILLTKADASITHSYVYIYVLYHKTTEVGKTARSQHTRCCDLGVVTRRERKGWQMSASSGHTYRQVSSIACSYESSDSASSTVVSSNMATSSIAKQF